MIISKLTNWSKLWVETTGSFQNHPNLFKDYHYMVLLQTFTISVWHCNCHKIVPHYMTLSQRCNKFIVIVYSFLQKWTLFSTKWAIILDVFTSSIVRCSFVSTPPNCYILHHQSGSSHPSSRWWYDALTLTVGGQEVWEWG